MGEQNPNWGEPLTQLPMSSLIVVFTHKINRSFSCLLAVKTSSVEFLSWAFEKRRKDRKKEITAFIKNPYRARVLIDDGKPNAQMTGNLPRHSLFLRRQRETIEAQEALVPTK